MREAVVALVSGMAAFAIKLHSERDSLTLSWTSLKTLLFPIAVAGTVFITWDVIRATRQLIDEVKAESEQEIDLYPSLVLTERVTTKRTPVAYRLKIICFASLLIAVCVALCGLSWGYNGNSAPSGVAQDTPLSRQDPILSTTRVPSIAPVSLPSPSPSPSATARATPTPTVTPSPVLTPIATATPKAAAATTPSPEPIPSPNDRGPSIGPDFGRFLSNLTSLHRGYKTYHILSPAGIGMCDYYVRLGMMRYTTRVFVALYVRQSYCARYIFDNVANNYETIVQDLKVEVKNGDLHILDLTVEPTVFVYSDDSVSRVLAAAGTYKGIAFMLER